MHNKGSRQKQTIKYYANIAIFPYTVCIAPCTAFLSDFDKLFIGLLDIFSAAMWRRLLYSCVLIINAAGHCPTCILHLKMFSFRCDKPPASQQCTINLWQELNLLLCCDCFLLVYLILWSPNNDIFHLEQKHHRVLLKEKK